MRFGMGGGALAVAFVAAAAALAGDRPKSGPQEGGHVGAFDVRDITGPNKGKTLCYV